MKNLKELGLDVYIQCKTQEEYDFINNELGYKWTNGTWEIYKDKTCIRTSGNFFEFVDNLSIGNILVQAADYMPNVIDQIAELKAKLAELEQKVKPKKKIEFVKFLNTRSFIIINAVNNPETFKHITLLHKGINEEYDLMKAWVGDESCTLIFLGHYNDGIV
jgi:hypothetical protein